MIAQNKLTIKQETLYSEDHLLPLSALQHYLFCRRQCALIHIEQVWQENFFTAQGRNLHERVDKSGQRPGRDCRVEYSVALRSYRLGLVGKADVVEFHKRQTEGKALWIPYPVEYKRGRPKEKDWDRVQLCAQALCLEEQLEMEVAEGALFYGRTRRREKVIFDKALREKTIAASTGLHDFLAAGITPPAKYSKRCRSCSLIDACMPRLSGKDRVRKYIEGALEAL